MDFATEQARQFAADGKAEAGAAVFSAGRGVGLLECFEDDLLFLGRDADTGVADFEGHDRRCLAEHWVVRAPATHRGGDIKTNRPLSGEFERIGQQVLEDLLQALRVGRDGAPEIGIDMDFER